MTERKVLNRYYPVDYDPAKIPKLKRKQKEANRLWGIRVMAPFNMRCNTCGEYIYKGKKFNSKKETVEDEDYLGIQIHRFYIRCPRCVAVIAFKTDPENCDYTCEAGATRNFEAAKTLLDMEKKKQKEAEEEEAANPMKVLENRTKQSRNEMDTIEAINELKELNARNEKVDHDLMIKKQHLFAEELVKLQKEAEDRMIRDLFGGDRAALNGESSDGSDYIKRIEDNSDSSDDEINNKIQKFEKLTDLLSEENSESLDKPVRNKATVSQPKKNSQKALLSGIIVKKKTTGIDNSNSPNQTPINEQKTSNENKATNEPKSCALTLLGGYSDSESSDTD